MNQIARHWIDGKWLAQGESCPTHNVYNGAVSGGFHMGSHQIAEQAISVARHAFEKTAWAHTPRLRAAVLLELASAISDRKQDIARAIATENGKIIGHCHHETNAAISEAQYYAGLARAIFGRVSEIDEGRQTILTPEPTGVAAIIVPWNAPSTLLLRSLGPALAAGCTVVIKGAQQTSSVNQIFAECLASCPSLPVGVVNLVHGDIDVAQVMTTHVDVDVVSFTGSSATGKKIMAAGAPTLKRLSLELGGKAPALVFQDANFATAAREITNGLIAHSGQMCTAVTRILVADKAWETFVPLLVDALKSISAGDPFAENIRMGPLINDASAQRYLNDTEHAATVGETILKGAISPDHPLQNIVTPALYHITDRTHRLVQDELFAPIGILERFTSEEAAVDSANATRYGLAASVHTADHDRARRVARALRSGTVWINCHNRLFAEAETGGFRESGLGRLHGLEGLSDFMETKHIYAEFGRVQADR